MFLATVTTVIFEDEDCHDQKNIFVKISINNKNHSCSHGTVASTLRVTCENTWATNVCVPQSSSTIKSPEIL